MSKKSKKEDTPIQMVIALMIGCYNFIITKNFFSAFIAYIESILILLLITYIYYHIKNKNKNKLSSNVTDINYKQHYRSFNNKRNYDLLNSGIDIADKMSGEEFEKFLLVHFQKLGYNGITTPQTNDYGADLVLTRDGEKIVVQAKRWNSYVGIEAVQQVIGAKSYYRANNCIVATNSYFTPNAINLAKSSSVKLWDRSKLLEIMNDTEEIEIAKEIINKTKLNINKKIICPICGNEMVIRKGKYNNFYGCYGYPKCRFTRKINL